MGPKAGPQIVCFTRFDCLTVTLHLSLYKPSMSQPAQEEINMEDRLRERMDTSMLKSHSNFSPLNSSSSPGAGDIPQSAQNQTSQGDSSFSDGSGPIFNMYVKMAEEEDKTMAERWKTDADGILIFVCFHTNLHTFYTAPRLNIIDWFVLCCCSRIDRGVDSRPQAEFAGYRCVLSREHLSASRGPQYNSYIYPCHSTSTYPLLSSEIRNLGELTVVLELGDQPYMCTLGDLVTAVVTPISHSYATTTIQPTQASADSHILCGWGRQVAPSFGC
jgi:hypothetical protein